MIDSHESGRILASSRKPSTTCVGIAKWPCNSYGFSKLMQNGFSENVFDTIKSGTLHTFAVKRKGGVNIQNVWYPTNKKSDFKNIETWDSFTDSIYGSVPRLPLHVLN